MNVRVHIERVVLEGIPIVSRERDLFERGLREALGAALLRPGCSLPATDVRERRVVAAPIDVGADAPAATLGERVGRSVHGAIRGGLRP